jgi:hypothetical protein
MSPDTTSIINTAIGALPSIIALIRGNHTSQNPGVPPPTDEEIIAGLQRAVESSIAKDDLWLAQHPQDDSSDR